METCWGKIRIYKSKCLGKGEDERVNPGAKDSVELYKSRDVLTKCTASIHSILIVATDVNEHIYWWGSFLWLSTASGRNGKEYMKM